MPREVSGIARIKGVAAGFALMKNERSYYFLNVSSPYSGIQAGGEVKVCYKSVVLFVSIN